MQAPLVSCLIYRYIAPLDRKALTAHCQSHGPAYLVDIYRLNYPDLIQAQDEQDCNSKGCRKGGEHAALEALVLVPRSKRHGGIKKFFPVAKPGHGQTEGSSQSTASTYRLSLHQPLTKNGGPLVVSIP